jgi:hypothetical protein
MLEFRDLVQKMESRMTGREEHLNPDLPPLPPRWEVRSGSDSDKDICKDSSSSSSPQALNLHSPHSPTYKNAAKAPVQS